MGAFALKDMKTSVLREKSEKAQQQGTPDLEQTFDTVAELFKDKPEVWSEKICGDFDVSLSHPDPRVAEFVTISYSSLAPAGSRFKI